MKTVVGLFDQFDDARRAVQDLRDAGFSNEDISMIARDEGGQYSRYLDADRTGEKQDISDGAAAGAGVGAVLGGLGGLLVGLGALMIPGIGPVIAAGPIITTLAGAGVGAVAGGVIGALVDLGIPEEHANYYAEGVKRGGTLVVLRANDDQADMAADIMNRYHPVDVERRAATWRQENNWQQFNANEEAGDYSRMQNSSAIPVTGTDDTDLGGGMDSTRQDSGQGTGSDWHTDQDMHTGTGGTTDRDYNTGVGNQGYNRGTTDTGSGMGGDFDRSRSDQDFDQSSYRSSDSDMDDDIPVTGGVMRETYYSETVTPDTGAQPMDRDWSYYDNQFRTDYMDRYGSAGQSYAYYQPAYRFGYDLGMDDQYRDWDWDRMEPYARQEWQRRGLTGAWEDFKDAVRHAWESVTH